MQKYRSHFKSKKKKVLVTDAWYKILNTKPLTDIEIMNQQLSYNRLIKINNEYINEKYIKQTDLKIKSCQETNKEDNRTICSMKWNSIVSAIPKELKNKLK